MRLKHLLVLSFALLGLGCDKVYHPAVTLPEAIRMSTDAENGITEMNLNLRSENTSQTDQISKLTRSWEISDSNVAEIRTINGDKDQIKIIAKKAGVATLSLKYLQGGLHFSTGKVIVDNPGEDAYNVTEITKPEIKDNKLIAQFAMDANRNIYVPDPDLSRIQKIATDGHVSIYAGGGSREAKVGEKATDVALSGIEGLLRDQADNMYLTVSRGQTGNRQFLKVDNNGVITSIDTVSFAPAAVDQDGNFYFIGTSRILKRDKNGDITTVAGNGTTGFSGDGGPATQAQLNESNKLAIDKNGNLYIADFKNTRIRKVDKQGIITTFAGTGDSGYTGDGGPATQAHIEVSSFGGMAFDRQGQNLYIAGSASGAIRKIDQNGTITTFALVDKQISFADLKFDETGNLYYLAANGISKVTVEASP